MTRKNVYYVVMVLMVALLGWALYACESSTRLRTVYISEITAAGSENYGLKITFAKDSRVDEKYVDIQIKLDKAAELTFWQENDEKLTLQIEDFDEWYSLTSLIATAQDKAGTEQFEKYSEAAGKTYMFAHDGALEITLRAVVGEVEENSDGTGQILVGSEPVSKQFTLKIK